ncbi:MAG: HPP family protein [Halanaeroarchaeum sp.]
MVAGLDRLLTARSAVGRHLSQRLVRARRWLAATSHLERVSVLVFVPLLIAFVTALSNAIGSVSFLLFPPLASGTYTLFADPEGQYASPVKFVGGMTLGAVSGWAALVVSARFVYHVPVGPMDVHPGGAAFGILLTGILTWLLDLEEPTAFSTALLVLTTGASRFAYIVGVALSSALVAVVFVIWRSAFFEERANYLYEATHADDRVLVPMRTDHADRVAHFGGRLAAAHDASKLVLLGVVSDADVETASAEIEAEAVETAATYVAEEASPAERRAADVTARRLEGTATRIQSRLDVPTQVVVARESEDLAGAVLDAARAADCDLVVAPYEERDGELAAYIRDLFAARFDVIAFQPNREEPAWNRVMVTVRRAGDIASSMVEYAERLVGESGSLSVCSVIDEEGERRSAERMLAELVDVIDVGAETRVSRSSFGDFLRRNQSHYDLVLMGASTDRSAASRFVRRPAFERVSEVDTDVAIVHRG